MFLVAVYSAAFDRDGLHLHMCSGLTRKLQDLHHLRGYGESLAILPKNGLFHPPERSCPQSGGQTILWQDSLVLGIVAL